MSKENANLRLLGSPVNLTYRSKRKDDRKNIRNRPRSALQNSCISPEHQERFRRPFSADAKGRAPSTRSFFKTFSAELLQSYNNSITPIKIVAPTLDLLTNGSAREKQNVRKDREICSNASDYGSEDTFISLGTKIKARAQLSPKPKVTNPKNLLKYRNIAKKASKMDSPINEENSRSEYSMEVKITERTPSPEKNKNMYRDRSLSPPKTRSYESYFIPLDGGRKENEDIVGRVSFSSNVQSEVADAIDSYSRRLNLTKQQLSLVEEECTQDLDTLPSHNLSSLSPENSLEDARGHDHIDTARGNDLMDEIQGNEYSEASAMLVSEPRTYTSFYDDISNGAYKNKLSSTIHTDSSSKDSGYPDSAINDDKCYRQNYSLPTTTLHEKAITQEKLEDQPKSLDSTSSSGNGKVYHNTLSLDKRRQWTEPLNHSRLLYKDFFLQKEGHVALPPQNSPNKDKVINDSNTKNMEDAKDNEFENENELEYPTYLLNSTTKAYTSKVIEDYRRELQAINNLHELTIKDIKCDAISPTPLNIDKMFEDNSNIGDRKRENTSYSEVQTIYSPAKTRNDLDMRKRDISKISTKELIQNYFKVKDGDIKENASKVLKKKVTNLRSKDDNLGYRHEWNNKTRSTTNQNISVIRNQTQKSLPTAKIPSSARIEGIENDKDVESWMSLSAPSPRILEVDREEVLPEEPMRSEPLISNENNIVNERVASSKTTSPRDKDSFKVKELNSNSTVLDIYSMLKEIENCGDNPVTTALKNQDDEKANSNTEEETPLPKDNFMEIFQFLEKVEQSANDALSVVTSSAPQTVPKLESLLKLSQTELAQRLVTSSLQLEERSCCIALLQESLANHKEQMIQKVSNLEKQSIRNINKVKQECEDTIKRHQNFIDQLINDKKTLNHRIEQLVDERRSAEERWKRAAQTLEERYKLELRNQHDKMAAAQQVARQRWVRQKAEKIKELTVKGLEGELREMADRQQKEVSDLKMFHAEQIGRSQAKHAQELEELRRCLEEEKEAALLRERQLASSRLEKQILEIELTYQEQRTRLVAEIRAENERIAAELAEKEKAQRNEIEKWRQAEERALKEKRSQLEHEIAQEKIKLEEQLKQKQEDLEKRFEEHKKEFEAEQQVLLKKKVTEIAAQHKQERDREIEKAIESMEAEAQTGRKELQEALRRNKEQFELELKELAETEQATLRRYQDAQARVRQTEDRCAELEVSISQLETRNRIMTEKNSQLEARAEEVRENCEKVWQAKVDALNKNLEDMKRIHEEQMQQLYAKVKVAVARKDSAIQALNRENGKYQEKITILEQKLQQQRKDFLKQK
ncbi:centrosomal protein of 131 kDa [Bombyx mandarina]|uniref:Centrosomal protein of 131 kDa n=1 Tax=Bombyx mandarina TaxID=7092 RepID=A0A6J2JL86_BOMMA|nr:centrosomal protein of 131 kDa [Bombyx mandarina]